MHFGGAILLHPTAALIVWLAAVLVTQMLGFAGLTVLLLLFVVGGVTVCRTWLRYLFRSRWLLLALWLVLAYHTPGDAWLEQDWLPTLEGMHDATLQSLRLAVMLAALAWLFSRLGREGMLGALWGLFRPLAGYVTGVERVVVRLSLVFSNLDVRLPGWSWRQVLLEDAPQTSDGGGSVTLCLPVWSGRDTVACGVIALGLLGVVIL